MPTHTNGQNTANMKQLRLLFFFDSSRFRSIMRNAAHVGILRNALSSSMTTKRGRCSISAARCATSHRSADATEQTAVSSLSRRTWFSCSTTAWHLPLSEKPSTALQPLMPFDVYTDVLGSCHAADDKRAVGGVTMTKIRRSGRKYVKATLRLCMNLSTSAAAIAFRSVFPSPLSFIGM